MKFPRTGSASTRPGSGGDSDSAYSFSFQKCAQSGASVTRFASPCEICHAKCPDGREPIMDKSDSTEEAMVCASGQHAEVYVSDLKHLLSVGTLDAAGDDKPCRPQVMQLAVGDFTVCVETRDYGYDCEKPLAAPSALSRWLCFLPSPATPAPPPIRVPLDRGERVGWTSDSCERNCPVQWTQTTRPLARAEPVPSVTRMLLCVAGAEEDA